VLIIIPKTMSQWGTLVPLLFINSSLIGDALAVNKNPPDIIP